MQPDRLARMVPGSASGGSLSGRIFLNKYQVINRLGEGAMGQVFLARRRDDGARVVVKTMRAEFASQPHFREMFEREMEFMARFAHPNVVGLLEASLKDPLGPCIVMEYVAGIDLEQLLQRQRRFAAPRVGRLLGQLCSALQAAHAEGIIHRDLKPANIMVVEPDTPKETIKVMDFGLAKLSVAPHIRLEKLRGDNRAVATGTPEYMASEQARGDDVDHRADLYSVGVILYELLTGRLPFNRKTIEEMLKAHAEDPPPSFANSGAAGVVSPAVEKVVMWCLSKYPNERPKDAWELAERFESALGQKVIDRSASPPPAAASAPKPAAPTPEPPPPADPNAIVYHLEAWMPESIATLKLRGFVMESGGDVTESVPGIIRVSLGGPKCKYQVGGAAPADAKKRGGWFGSSTPAPAAPTNLIDMELHMRKQAGGQNLKITLMLKPSRGSTIRKTSPEWRNCCDRIHNDLRAYLMSK